MTLRLRTGYSFRSAVGKIEDVQQHLRNIGQKFAPITDTASTFGYVKWRKAAKKNGLKPVFGVELAVTTSINEKKPSVDYWTFIAKSNLKPVHDLVQKATGQFRYQPLLTREQALEAADELFVIMGYRTRFEEISPRPALYAGLGPSLTLGQFRRAKEAGHYFVPVSDNRYTKQGQQGLYETICGRGASTQSYPQWIMSKDEWIKDCIDRIGVPEDEVIDALERANHIVDFSTADLAPGEMVKPEKRQSLRDMCLDGARDLACDLSRPEYTERLNRELSLIEEKKFEDYFYIVSDICQWARKLMIVGPARGSSCGSLVCYLLKITSIDPIPFGLIFERFIDINRNDLPDIDIDFPEDRRDEVFAYIARKYGQNKVARLGTVAMYQPRSALKEAAGALDIEPWLLDPVVDSIIKRSSGDARALQSTEDTFKDTTAGREFIEKYPEILVAAQMEGHPRHASSHAAGIVITDQPINNYVAYDSRTGAIMCDKKDAEELNLLKIDALGLTQLSVFEYALRLANMPMNHLDTIALNDPLAFEILNNQRFAGIFQFNGLAMQMTTSMVKTRELNDIVSITALARPGPLNTGGTNRWIAIKNKQEPESYPHPAFEPFLKKTLGVVAYQEQVMNIGREIGDLSWEDVTALRKAMSRSLGAEFFNQYGDRWKAGARKKNIPEETLEKVWDDLCAYGSWAFNESHAVAYGLVSYWCCWFKAHYPVEFAAATLTYERRPEAQIKLLRELASEGIEYVPADIEHSTDKWGVKKDGNRSILVGPLSNIIGCGPKMQASIIRCRDTGEKLPTSIQKRLNNFKTNIDSLWPVRDNIKRLLEENEELRLSTPSVPKPIIELQPNGEAYRVAVHAIIQEIKPKNENEPLAVAKRGSKLTGPTDYLNLRISDDTDIIFAKIDRFKFERLGRPIIERGKAKKAIYAFSGNVPRSFRMLSIDKVKYLGDME